MRPSRYAVDLFRAVDFIPRNGTPFRASSLIEHDLFGKPLHTFPDHALADVFDR
jgi:hypothetical protein